MIEEKKPGLLKAIILTGLLAGTLDTLGATTHFLAVGGKDPLRIWNFVASGIFGRASLEGGLTYTILGLIFHYCIATTWTYVYFKIYPYVGFFRRNWIVSGSIYAVIVWLGMNQVVLPLSNVPQRPFSLQGAIVGATVLIICIGLPIAWRAKNHFKS